MNDDRRLVVVVVSGPDAHARAVFGLASALTAAISGVEVRVLLSMNGAHWAAEGTGAAEAIGDFPSIDELLGELGRCGVPVEASAASLQIYCPRGSGGDLRLREMITVVDHDGVPAALGGAPSVLC